MKRITVASWIILLALTGANASAEPEDELAKLSVDDLMDVDVTSVARHGQKLSNTAAAVFVISQEDIVRSGATSIAEVRRGDVIELKMISGRVRFDINFAAASNAGLHISSKLMSLAVTVYGQPLVVHKP